MDMKEYMAPEMEVEELKYQGILCVSINESDGDDDPMNNGGGGNDPNVPFG